MSNASEKLFYTKSHEWIEQLEDGTLKIGITDYAQTLLGDIVFVELPEPDQKLSVGDGFAVIESVKSASDVYAPVSGIVIAINEKLHEQPELINEFAFNQGWLIQIMPDEGNLSGLMTAKAYEASIKE